MSRSPSFTEPVTRAIGFVSCIRFKQRTNVDLPQPEGPINAVARFAGIARLISCRVCVPPYQAFRFCTSIPAPTYAPNVAVQTCPAGSNPTSPWTPHRCTYSRGQRSAAILPCYRREEQETLPGCLEPSRGVTRAMHGRPVSARLSIFCKQAMNRQCRSIQARQWIVARCFRSQGESTQQTRIVGADGRTQLRAREPVSSTSGYPWSFHPSKPPRNGRIRSMPKRRMVNATRALVASLGQVQ